MEKRDALAETAVTHYNTTATVPGDQFEKASENMTAAGYEIVNGIAAIGAAVLIIAAINGRVRARNK